MGCGAAARNAGTACAGGVCAKRGWSRSAPCPALYRGPLATVTLQGSGRETVLRPVVWPLHVDSQPYAGISRLAAAGRVRVLTCLTHMGLSRHRAVLQYAAHSNTLIIHTSTVADMEPSPLPSPAVAPP